MPRTRYTIGADVRTLAAFVDLVAVNPRDTFIERVTPDKNDEYYYIVLDAPKSIHDVLKADSNFRNVERVTLPAVK